MCVPDNLLERISRTARSLLCRVTKALHFSLFVLGLAILLQVGFEIDPSHTMDLVYGTLILATTTLIGYLLQNFGVPLVGPSLASVIGASGPAVTALMAFFLFGHNFSFKFKLLMPISIVLL